MSSGFRRAITAASLSDTVARQLRRCGAYPRQSPAEVERLKFVGLVERYASRWAVFHVLARLDPSGHFSMDKIKRWLSTTAGYAVPVPAWAIRGLEEDLGVASDRRVG